MLALSFLAGLDPKKVRAWFDYERRKSVKNEGPFAIEPPEVCGLEEQGLDDARAITFQYNQDPKRYARELVFGERCVRTGSWDDGGEAELQRPRPNLKKYWRRMFPEQGGERTLEDVSRELAVGSAANST